MPTIVVPCSLNAEIDEDAPGSDKSEADGIRIDVSLSLTAFRGLFRFPITATAKGARGAFIRLRQTGASGALGVFTSKRITQDAWSTDATWLLASIGGSTLWVDEGGDLTDSSVYPITNAQPRLSAGLFDIDVFGHWFDAKAAGLTDLDILVKIADEASSGLLCGNTFDSIESGITPTLHVVYPGESRRPYGNRPWNSRPWTNRPANER